MVQIGAAAWCRAGHGQWVYAGYQCGTWRGLNRRVAGSFLLRPPAMPRGGYRALPLRQRQRRSLDPDQPRSRPDMAAGLRPPFIGIQADRTSPAAGRGSLVSEFAGYFAFWSMTTGTLFDKGHLGPVDACAN